MSYNKAELIPAKKIRKTLFMYRLLRPRKQRKQNVVKCCSAQFVNVVHNKRNNYKHLKVAEINVNGLSKKYSFVKDIITDYNVDIMAICETRHASSEDVILRKIVPKGYCCFYMARGLNDARVVQGNIYGPIGGGVATIVRENMKPMRIELVHDQKTFEYVCSL